MQDYSSPNSQPSRQPSGRKKYRRNYAKYKRIMLALPEGLLQLVDTTAKKEFTTRSSLIRTAIHWYLMPQGRDLAKLDPDTVFETLQRRKRKAEYNKFMQEFGNELDPYDS